MGQIDPRGLQSARRGGRRHPGALQMVRAGKKINFVGAGATVDFDERGDQINRSFVHQVIENGKNRIIEVVT